MTEKPLPELYDILLSGVRELGRATLDLAVAAALREGLSQERIVALVAAYGDLDSARAALEAPVDTRTVLREVRE